MPIPSYQKFIEPILRYLALHTQGARVRDVYETVASGLGLSDQEKLETYPTGWDTIYKNHSTDSVWKRSMFKRSDGRTLWGENQSKRSMAHLRVSTPRRVC